MSASTHHSMHPDRGLFSLSLAPMHTRRPHGRTLFAADVAAAAAALASHSRNAELARASRLARAASPPITSFGRFNVVASLARLFHLYFPFPFPFSLFPFSVSLFPFSPLTGTYLAYFLFFFIILLPFLPTCFASFKYPKHMRALSSSARPSAQLSARLSTRPSAHTCACPSACPSCKHSFCLIRFSFHFLSASVSFIYI